MHYIAFVYKNTREPTTAEEWQDFFARARAAGIFRGGGAIGITYRLGDPEIPDLSDDISGFMRFETEALGELTELLDSHPVVRKGGSIALCEVPKCTAP